eukprot:221721-Amphidinium_carterae.1
MQYNKEEHEWNNHHLLGFTFATHQQDTVDNGVVISRGRTLCNGTSHNPGTAHQAGDTGDDNSKVEQAHHYVNQHRQLSRKSSCQ